MIYVRKKGIFYENDFKPGSEEYICTRVESFIPYLNEIIHIDSKITLEDLFSFIEKDKEIVDIIFGSYIGHISLSQFFDEIKKDCMIESREELECIEFRWVIEQFNYERFFKKFKDDKKESILRSLREPENETNEIQIYIDVSCWGEREVSDKNKDTSTYVSYAIEFIPLYRIKHLPIKLNKKFIIKDENYDGKEHIVVNGEKEFSVFDVLEAILSEISFLGLPEERDERLKDIMNDFEEHNENFGEDDDEDDE